MSNSRVRSRCTEDGCHNRVRPSPGQKYKKCKSCRELAARLEAIHRDTDAPLETKNRRTAEEEQLIREQILTHRVAARSR